MVMSDEPENPMSAVCPIETRKIVSPHNGLVDTSTSTRILERLYLSVEHDRNFASPQHTWRNLCKCAVRQTSWIIIPRDKECFIANSDNTVINWWNGSEGISNLEFPFDSNISRTAMSFRSRWVL
jgi:hypothetical protein